MAPARTAAAGPGVALRDIALRLPGQQFFLADPHRRPVARRHIRHFLDHADCIFGAGLDAQAAEDAARVVNFETRRVLRVHGIARVERSVDLYHLGRAHGRAHVAGDALRLAGTVGALCQNVLAAVAGCIVEARLFRVVAGQRALAPGHPLRHVAHEDAPGDPDPAQDLRQVEALPDAHRRLVPVDLAPVRVSVVGHYAPIARSAQTNTTVTTRLASASGNMNFHAKRS